MTNSAIIRTGIGPVGPAGPPGPAGSGDTKFTYDHSFSSSDIWVIAHNLGKYPSVTVVDSTGEEVIGFGAHYTDVNNVTLTYAAGFAGYAYLN